MNTKHIEAFVRETGFKFEDNGEIGFGRKCVGIINQKTESYLAYQHYDYDDMKEIMRHDVAMGSAPDNAYHKGPYLAVLHDGSEEGRIAAINELNDWIEKIMAASYELKPYTEKNSITSLLMGGSVTQICLTGGVSYGRFVEIF